jgi:PAS domain S-box-containing protein
MGMSARTRSVRFHLVTLGLASVLPMLLFAVVMVMVYDRQQRAVLERSFRDTARVLTLAVDHEVSASLSTLGALATSKHLDTGDLRAFYDGAQRVLRAQSAWSTINLFNAAGQQLINLARPFGAPLPDSRALADVRQALDTGRPAISDLFVGLVLKTQVVGIAVPVRRQGALKYVLGARLKTELLNRLLAASGLPAESVATLIDRKGTIVARTRDIERLLGTPATPKFVGLIHSAAPEGSFQDVTRDGLFVYSAYSRSPLTGWTVGIGVPIETVDAPRRTSLWLAAGGGLVLLLVSAGLTLGMGRRIAGDITSLSDTARGIGRADGLARPRPASITEVQRVEQAFQESEQRTQRIVTHALDAVITIDFEGRITSWNPQAEATFGWPAAAVLGRRLSETIIPPAHREAHERGLARYRQTGEGPVLGRRIELTALRRDGAEIAVELAITPIQVGGATVFSAFLRDITERKGAEEARQQSEASFRLLFASNPLPMWVYDVATLYFLEVNAAAVAHYGYSQEEFLRMRIKDIRPPEEVRRLMDVVAGFSEGSSPEVRRHAGSWRHRLKDGRIREVDIASHAIDFAGRRAALVVAIDVTELKQAEASLAKSAERLTILHDIDAAIIAADAPEAIAQAALRRLRDLLGVPRAIVNLFDLAAGEVEWLAAIGRRRLRVGPGVRFPLWLMGDVQALARGEVQVIDTAALPRGPHTEALLASGVNTYMVVPMIAGGELIGAVSFGGVRAEFPPEQVEIAREVAAQLAIALAQARLHERVKRQAEELEQRVHERTDELSAANAQLQQEIAERRRAEAAAEHANRAKSEFLSRMSHELRTPLNAVLGFGQLLEMDSLSPKQTESVGQILKGGRRLLGLIDEVLEISRIEAGRLRISLEPVPVSATLREAIALMRPIAADRRVEVRAEFSDDGRHVLADRQRLQQVILNLLSNAVKYNRADGVVIVSCAETSGQQLSIRVTDTGPGIPPDKLERLFTPFDRLGAEATDVEGTGLGLTLSKHLVEVMGGALRVESGIGIGSTFAVVLPMVTEPVRKLEPLPLAPRSSSPDESAGSVLLLYVEDNLSNLRLVEQIVTLRPTVKLLTAMQGRLGLDLAREHRPDLILLDRHLPDISGDEVLGLLLVDPRTRDIPIVMLSADASRREMQRLLDAGARAYLTKPLDLKEFLELLDELGSKRTP